jgi:hypothetical protein
MDLVRAPHFENLTSNDFSVSNWSNRIILVPTCFNSVSLTSQIGNCVIASTELPGASQSPSVTWIPCFPSTLPNGKRLGQKLWLYQTQSHSLQMQPKCLQRSACFWNPYGVCRWNVTSLGDYWRACDFPTRLKVLNNVRPRNRKMCVVCRAKATIRTIAVVSRFIKSLGRWLEQLSINDIACSCSISLSLRIFATYGTNIDLIYSATILPFI